MQKLRDDPECADEEFAAARRFDAPGLQPKLSFDPADDVAAPYVNTGARPRVAILRERSEEHTSELQSLMRSSYAVVCLKKKKHTTSNYSEYSNDNSIQRIPN